MKIKPLLLACALAWPIAAHADPIVAVAFLAPIIGGTAAAFVVTYASYIFFAAVTAYSYNRQRAAKRKARDAYNASLRDRLQMVDIQPDAARTLCLGRVRTVEGIRRRWSSGTNSEKLTLIVSFAGHEIDGYDEWYLDDTLVTLDGSGYVQEAPWNTSARTSKTMTVTLDGSGGKVQVLPSVPVSGSVTAVYDIGSYGVDYQEGSLTVSVAGSTATISGGPAGVTARINWQTAEGASLVRIRPYLGTATQNVGGDIAAEFTGQITSTDKFAGIALAVVDLQYNPDVFPQGVPNVTARIRGARVYDPRLDSTNGGSGSHRLANASTWEFSENPALHAYHYCRLATGWNVPASEIRTADVVAAADACAVSTTFTLRKPDATTTTVTMARFRCGIVIPTDADPQAMMSEILESMAGRSGWAGGTWRMRAGVMATPVWDMDASWIAQRLAADGTPDTGSVVRISNGVQRDSKVNRVTGACVDRDQRWQVLPFPGVEDPVLIASEGEYAVEVEYQGVNHVAHAQHLASIAIRESQAALRMEATCNLSAYRCELFDVGSVTLPRYGMTAKTFEVVGWRWHPTEGVRLSTAEITDEIFTVDAELGGRDPAPDSSLPPPWDVERVTGLSATNAAVILSDGTIQTRTTVTWDAVDSQAIRAGGQIEVQWTLARDNLPAGDWPSRFEQGGNTETQIDGLIAGRQYVFRARAINSLRVRGDWSRQFSTGITGKDTDPSNVSGFAGTVGKTKITWSWDRPSDDDYDETELRSGGSGWNTATFEWRGRSTRYQQAITAAGSYTMRARHFDKSGNDSASTASATVTVDPDEADEVRAFSAGAADPQVASGIAANAYVRLNRDGTVETKVGTGAWTAAGEWHTPSGGTPGDDYQVRTTATGSTLNSGTLNTWQALTTAREWNLRQAVSGGYAEKITDLQFVLAANGDTKPLATGFGFLFASYDP